MFEKLKTIQDRLREKVSLKFKRYYFDSIFESKNVVWVVGERGIWKTYSLLQVAKMSKKSFYFSADSVLSHGMWVFDTVYDLVINRKVSVILIDEIHKYDNWKVELKNIVDSFPDVKIVFSWSSSLDIIKWTIDLARRVKIIKIYPLNFREFLEFQYWIEIEDLTFERLINDYCEISFDFSWKINEKHIQEYFLYWFYPFFKSEKIDDFQDKLYSTLEKIIVDDLPSFVNTQTSTLIKLKKIFYYIANNLPSNISYLSLSKKIWINKDTLENIIFILSKIWVLNLVSKSPNLSDVVRKEFKVFLWNPNLYYALNSEIEIWTIRECYILHFLKKLITPRNEIDTTLLLPKSWDVLFKYKWQSYIFEIWWKNKTNKQIKWTKNSFIVADNIIIWEKWKIPLWLFGLI